MARWSFEEVERLQEYYYDTPKKELLEKFPDRTWKSIVRKAQRENLNRKRLNENENVWTESEVPSWFNGELVSDGSIVPDGRYTHTTAKKEYAEFLTEKFNEENISVNVTENSYVDGRTNNEYQRWIVRTKSVFKNLRKTWYPDGKKQVPDNFAVDEDCLLHWILGDGHISEGVFLCTEGFTNSSLDTLVKSLLDFGIKTTKLKSGNLYIRRTKTNKEIMKNTLLGNKQRFPACYQYKKEKLCSWAEG